MSGGAVLVVRTGTANLASVRAGLARAGAASELTGDPAAVRSADRVVLPGVGAFGAAAAALAADGLDEALRERVAAGRPTLAVCLGQQLLAEGSGESPGVPGLGAFPGTVERFPAGVRIPQLGWNFVAPGPGCRWLTPGYAWFANSYRLTVAPAGWKAAWAEHGTRFVAALERDGVLACQFHPELSGPWGQDLLRRWLETTEGGRGC